MAEQLATNVQNPVSYTEISDAVLAERIDSAQSSLDYLSGKRRQTVMKSLTYLLFEQEARSGSRHSADRWAGTELAVQEYDMYYGVGSAAHDSFVSPELETSGGAVANS